MHLVAMGLSGVPPRVIRTQRTHFGDQNSPQRARASRIDGSRAIKHPGINQATKHTASRLLLAFKNRQAERASAKERYSARVLVYGHRSDPPRLGIILVANGHQAG